MQNVEALRMLAGVFNKMPSSHDAVPWNALLEDLPCTGIVRKLLCILNKCVKNVYSQMMLLLFVFYELVVMQVLWMKGCTIML
jgi:hypothetical protein